LYPRGWRPLINALCKVVVVEWRAPEEAETNWFTGTVTAEATPPRSTEPTVVSCADPHHEVVESSRWARQLIASGTAKPHEIVITSATTMA